MVKGMKSLLMPEIGKLALQLSRIVFPLPYYTMEKKEHIEKEQWKHDPLFSRQDAYTCLLYTSL